MLNLLSVCERACMFVCVHFQVDKQVHVHLHACGAQRSTSRAIHLCLVSSCFLQDNTFHWDLGLNNEAKLAV